MRWTLRKSSAAPQRSWGWYERGCTRNFWLRGRFCNRGIQERKAGARLDARGMRVRAGTRNAHTRADGRQGKEAATQSRSPETGFQRFGRFPTFRTATLTGVVAPKTVVPDKALVFFFFEIPPKNVRNFANKFPKNILNKLSRGKSFLFSSASGGLHVNAKLASCPK